MVRRLQSAVVFLLLSVALGAQGTAPVLVTLTAANRQGSFMTGSVVVPANMTGYIRVTLTIPNAADHTDPTLSVWMRLYYLNDQGQWQFIRGPRWTGNTGTIPGQLIGTALRVYVPDPDNPTQALAGTADWRGKTLRAEIDIANTMRVGCVVDNPQSPLTEGVQ